MADLISSENYNIAKKLLDVAITRHEALANNVANVQTPGFKRNEISTDFEAKLTSAIKNSDLDALNKLTPSIEKDTKTPSAKPDGNNVEVDRELVAITKNSAEIDFINYYLSNSIHRLKTAITGKNM